MRNSTLIPSALALIILSGCGGSPSSKTGGNSLTGKESVQTVGGLVTRVVGTAQPPVMAGSSGAVVTGLGGATISRMDQFDSQTNGSSAGSRIVWTAESNNSSEILVKNADGSGNVVNISNSAGRDFNPQWSPDGSKIAWSGDLNNSSEILVKNADGSGSVVNVSNSAGIDSNPQWSPDGSKIAWERGSEIWVKNADGSGTPVMVTKTAGYDNNPQWSPDGSKIVSSGFLNGNWEILVQNADGSGNALNISNHFAYDGLPQWSPDGSKISWISQRSGNFDLFIRNADGTGNEVNFSNNAGYDGAAEWSPDGSKIAWVANRNGNDEILVKNSDGSGTEVNLTNNSGNDFHHQWSPDGSKIVWRGDRNGNTEILIKNSDGSGAEFNLTNSPTIYDGFPQWSKSTFLPNATRSLLGPSGILGTNAAGVLVAQRDQAVTSVVAFDTQTAATRVNARIATNTGIAPELPNIVFTVTAGDALTSLRFINGPGTTGVVTAIGPGATVTTASGAVLTFDSADGMLVGVIPYIANRSAGSAPVTERSGELLIVRGRFPAILDSTGRNLALNGATEVRIEAKTGKLRDWR